MSHLTYRRHLENVVLFKKALIVATTKRHLDIASSFDREDGAKEGQEKLFIPSLVLSIQIFLQKTK